MNFGIMKKIFFLAFIFYSFSVFSQENFTEKTPETFVNSFMEELFNLKNKNDPTVLFNEIESYFDFHTIGYNLLGVNVRDFNENQFSEFSQLFRFYEFKELYPRIKNINEDNLKLHLANKREIARELGVIYILRYNYGTQTSSDRGEIEFYLIERGDTYKIINLNLDGINWLVTRRRHYRSLWDRVVDTPEEMNQYIRERL